MGKDDFNKLNLKDQIEFINKNLDSKTFVFFPIKNLFLLI